jgi:ribosomal protein S27E
MQAQNENKTKKNTGKPGFDVIRKQMFAVGSWFSGSLQGISEDEHDLALARSLQIWLSHQTARYDGLSIGFVQCTECGNTWEALAPTSTLNRLECPECGHRETLAVEPGSPDVLQNKMKLHIPE